MKKRSPLFDLFKIVLLFGGIWLLVIIVLKLLPEDIKASWSKTAEALKVSIEQEEKIGKSIIESMQENNSAYFINNNPVADSAINIIKLRLLENLGPTDYNYKLYLVDDTQINAFTLPGGHIVIFKGLIDFSDSPEEVAAVLAHEMGHVEERHVVKKLVKEFGLTIIFSVATGGDAVLIGELLQTTMSGVFDRKQEAEADQFALELLERSSINPRVMASFFRKLNREELTYNENLEFLMTHPHNNSRIKAALEYELQQDFREKSFALKWQKIKESFN